MDFLVSTESYEVQELDSGYRTQGRRLYSALDMTLGTRHYLGAQIKYLRQHIGQVSYLTPS